MNYELKVYCIWEYGKRKDAAGNPHQEDCTFPLPDSLKDSDRTFILCDGMGGHDAGEVASATVCEAMGSSILADGHDEEGLFSDEDLDNAISAAFAALDKKDSGAEKKMGTTMAFLKLHNDGATVAHIGDSRVYHIRPGKDGNETRILLRTEDHSLVNDLVKIGELTREDARKSRQKHVVTRAMQPNMSHHPKADIRHISDIRAGDFFYLCSDGMLEKEDMDSGESLKNIFSDAIESVDDKVDILTRVTEDNRDNHTALIVHILKVMDGIPAGAAAQSGLATATPKEETPRGTKSNIWKYVFGSLAFVLLAVICLAWFSYTPSEPQQQNAANTESVSGNEPDTGRKRENGRKPVKVKTTEPKTQSGPSNPRQLPQSQQTAPVASQTVTDASRAASDAVPDSREEPKAQPAENEPDNSVQPPTQYEI